MTGARLTNYLELGLNTASTIYTHAIGRIGVMVDVQGRHFDGIIWERSTQSTKVGI